MLVKIIAAIALLAIACFSAWNFTQYPFFIHAATVLMLLAISAGLYGLTIKDTSI